MHYTDSTSKKRYQFSGDNDDKETPVPIPNTEVKLIVLTILAGYPAGKISRCQVYISKKTSNDVFFVCNMVVILEKL